MVNAMNPVRRAASVRQGACQRCGWTQQVTRIDGHRPTRRGRCGYRWVCSDCLAELGLESTDASHPKGAGLISVA